MVRQAIRLETVAAIRLSVEIAGRSQQIVCRVTAQDGTHIVFGSQIWEGPARWRNNAVEFKTFLAELHRELRPRWPSISFVEGPSAGFRWAMFTLGSALALGAASATAFLFWNDQVAGFFLIPAIILGLWLALLFRPRKRQTYDPAIYAGQ